MRISDWSSDVCSSDLEPSAIIPDRRIYERRESGVRSYARSMPRQFVRAQGVWMHDSNGGRYLDFLSGCSTLNYGHNHPVLKAALTDYIADDGIEIGRASWKERVCQYD